MQTISERRARIAPQPESIVALARQIPNSRWGCWCVDGEKKPPIRPKYPKFSHNTFRDWEDVETVLARYADWRRADGVGFLVGCPGFHSGVVGLDFDNALDVGTGELLPNVQDNVREVLDLLKAEGIYIEVSQSGTGLHALWIGAKPVGFTGEKWGADSGAVSGELYDGNSTRYLATTGAAWHGSAPILHERPPEFSARIAALLGMNGGGSHGVSGVRPSAPAPAFNAAVDAWPVKSDEEILKLLRQNNKRGVVTRLLSGVHDGDASAARASLIGHAAYYTRDVEQIARIVGGSGLLASKDGEKRNGKPFGVWEVERVLNGLDPDEAGASYWVDQAEKIAGASMEKTARKGLVEKANDFLVGGLTGLTGPKGNLLQNQYTLAELFYRDRRLLGAVYYDEYSKMPIKTAAFGVISEGEVGEFGDVLTDKDMRRAEDWICRDWGVTLQPNEIRRIILAWSDRTSINTVVDRLNKYAEEWDGKSRALTWLKDYCGADAGDDAELEYYHSRVGVMFLLQVVARAYVPGAKCDCMVIFESPKQGQRKSSAARVLGEALSPRAFIEGFTLDKIDRDTKIALRGRAIVEFGELDGLTKHEASSLKNFVSLQADSYRDIYGAANTDWPRTVVWIGTTNETSYLRDPTGNRRYWPVAVQAIRLADLRADVGQLWGEAVQLYRHGVRWWIEEEGMEFAAEDARFRAVHRRETLRRMQPDTWSEMIDDFNELLAWGRIPHPKTPDLVATIDMSFKLVDLMAMAFGEDGKAARRSVPEEVRFRSALARAGWQHNGSNSHGKWSLSVEAKAEILKRIR